MGIPCFAVMVSILSVIPWSVPNCLELLLEVGRKVRDRLVGLAGGLALNRWGVALIAEEWAGFEFFTAPALLLVGTVAFCGVIGLLAGLYPAHRAARLDPIAALRSD